LSLITYEYHRVHPKRFLSLSYIWRKPCIYLAPTLNCLQTDQNEIPHDPRHLGVPLLASKTISEPMVCLAQTEHLSCAKTSTISKRTKSSFHFILVTNKYHWVCQKMISKPMVCLTQTVNLSCINTNTVSKRTETRFHMTHVTKKFHRERLK
jgi:hypothetical protein